MKTSSLALGLLVLAACQTAPSPNIPAPTADFAFAGSSAEELTVPTYNDVQLIDHSVRASSYRYTFGNDSTSTSATPRFYYTKPGTYTITLTVQDDYKQTATTTKRVRVLERVAKEVVIQNLNDEAHSPQPNLLNGTYWVVVRLGANNVQYPRPTNGNLSFETPILYQSPKVALTQASLPYSFELPTPLIINYPALRSYTLPTVRNNFGYTGVGYGFEIYEQDVNGNAYLLTSSYVPYYRSSSGGISDFGTDFQQKVLRTGYGGIYLKGDFE